MNPSTPSIIYPIFFLSGAAALVFEALWFRQAGLTFGSSVWASALVLSSFMAGLGIGNGLAARLGARIQRPIATYALLELVVAFTGLALVFGLPRLTPWFATALGFLDTSSAVAHAARFCGAFVLLLIPAIAMGATLPILVRAFARADTPFGTVLGRLYGINTIGAVAGAASAELLWIPMFGIRGSGWFASGLLCAGAALALLAGYKLEKPDATTRSDSIRADGFALEFRGLSLLSASFLSGLVLLGLEVVWFRLLALFMPPTSEVFALMLAVVLAGIGLGGLAAPLLIRLRPEGRHSPVVVALLAGCTTVLTYRLFPLAAERTGLEPVDVIPLCIFLTLPTSFLSGVLFTMLGNQLHDRLGSDTRATGLVTLANTLGSMLGPLVAGFLLLPVIGLETSLFVLTLGYTGVAIAALVATGSIRSRAVAAALLAFGAFVFEFPHGQTRSLYQQEFNRYYTAGERLVKVREESNQVIAYLRAEFMGEPLFYRLVTDSHSMSASTLYSTRYMYLFGTLPLVFHPSPRDALLISYGVGITAKSLTDQPELEHIDIVDISRGILEMSNVVMPGDENPLRDPRVDVHVEDGRHFLATTRRHYDLITGEPPPPAAAGIMNLYSREYFELLHSRLREGGVASYWLPIAGLSPKESKAITRAFCDVFEDCSLWEGGRGDWVLLGTRGEPRELSEDEIRRPWENPRTRLALANIGVERAEQLGALFLADARVLAAWTEGTEPLVDDRPDRAPRWRIAPPLPGEYVDMSFRAKERFAQTDLFGERWPKTFREAVLPYFEYQEVARSAVFRGELGSAADLPTLHKILSDTSLETLPLWLTGSNASRQSIVTGLAKQGRRSRAIDHELALGAIARRDYAKAAELLEGESRHGPGPLPAYRLYSLCMSGQRDVDPRDIDAVAERPNADRRLRALLDEVCEADAAVSPTL